jgi:hypothetical protein
MAISGSGTDTLTAVSAYGGSQVPALGAICEMLQAEIEKALPEATAKIWHGSPVWFIGENPIVGYSVRPKGVELMFWSGQLFEEPLLKALGKDKAAKVGFQDKSEINLPELRRWLVKAHTIVFDYVGMYGRKRETARLKRRP